MRVAIIHPDLGLGGAERLVLDISLSLTANHTPTIYTPHFDATRCFSELKSAAHPRVPVRHIRPPIPRAIFGKLHAILAALRAVYVALYVALFATPDIAIVDIVSLPLLVLYIFRIPAVFYCHFPDALLAKSLRPRPASPLRALYRRVVDRLEYLSLVAARSVACNSRFTAEAYRRQFPLLPAPVVIHPAVRTKPTRHGPRTRPADTLLSLNRYERKKAHTLAVETLRLLDEPPLRDLRLVIAGGFDQRLPENVQHFDELRQLVHSYALDRRVDLRTNVSDVEKDGLLASCLAVLYTPSDEHFGIVPLEAMAAGVPVIAVRSGGPCETVEHAVTGLLCEAQPRAFADAVRELRRGHVAMEMGQRGRERVHRLFSPDALRLQVENWIQSAVGH